jgi:DNA primase
VPLIEAAQIIADCCGVSSTEIAPGCNRRPSPRPAANQAASPNADARSGAHRRDNKSSRRPVHLDPSHRYLFDRGLSPEIIERFGLGYCAQGYFRGRICIPIHSPDGGRILAYAGRWACDPAPDGVPRYLLPRGFARQAVLFNFHRAKNAKHLVIVEGYWSVFRLHALGVPAVALMGTSLSAPQLELLRRSEAISLTLLLDADKAGRTANLKLLPRLAPSFFVRAPVLPDGSSPDNVQQDLLLAAVRLPPHFGNSGN